MRCPFGPAALRRWQASVAAPEPAEATSLSGLDERLAALRDMVWAEAFDPIGTAFLDSIPPRLDRLLTAVATDAVNEVRSLAHSIGGSCASLRADQMAQLAQCLELSTTPVAHLPGLAPSLG